MSTVDTKRRVKHYVLNDSRQWVDRGTGHVSWIYNDKQRSVSLIVKSENDQSILLEAKILVSIVYQRQQDTLIVWSDTNRRDLALSFQEKAGCDEIWEKICEVLGEDSSLDITSTRHSSSTNGAGGIDNLDESDEDQVLDNDINTSPSSDLPQCELNKLKEIRDFFILELPRKSKLYKERLASLLESDSYIKKLIEIFHISEDLENIEGLHFLFEIFRSLFYLNKSSLLDILLSDDLIMDVIGCLEYDPNKPEPQRHREFITTKSNFKQVISFDNTDLINKIHQTYKVQYIQDVILPAPSVFEENSLTSLSSFIFLNKVEISNIIQEDERFLYELFENLKNINLIIEKRRDMLQFLREFTSFLHSLQQTREPFFKSLYDHGILEIIEISLDIKDEKINVIAIEILSQFVEVSPTQVREFILNEIESKSSINNLNSNLKINNLTVITNSKTITNISNTATININQTSCSTTTSTLSNKVTAAITTNSNEKPTTSISITNLNNDIKINNKMLTLKEILNTDDVFEPVLINYVIRQMINDPDKELSGAMQIINVLKLLIDPENMLSAANKAEKSEFLSYFYRKSMCILINPLILNTTGLVINREDFRIAQLQNLILDFLSFCVEHHTYHIKNYIIHKDLLKRILILLKSKHQFLALSALRFLRKTLSLKEETYNRHIIKSNLFESVIHALKTNGSRYNILNSAIIELFDFIRSEDIKSLMVYTFENFNKDLEQITYVRTFKDLKLRYDQHKEKLNDQLNSRSRLNSSENSGLTTPTLYRTKISCERYRDKIDFDKDEDAWIEEDEDNYSESNRIEAKTTTITGSSNNDNLLISSSSSSSILNTNEEPLANRESQIESFIEFKKSQSQYNLDENEDTLFSPGKTINLPTSSSSIISSFSTAAINKSISIKISSNTSLLVNKKSSINQEQLEQNNNNLSPNGTLSSSQSNSPLLNKKLLVDYDSDDSDEEEKIDKDEKIKRSEQLYEEIDIENKEPLAKRPATDSNSILTQLIEEKQQQSLISENKTLNNNQMQIDQSNIMNKEKNIQEENKENEIKNVCTSLNNSLTSESVINTEINNININNGEHNFTEKIEENKIVNINNNDSIEIQFLNAMVNSNINENSDNNNNKLNEEEGNDEETLKNNSQSPKTANLNNNHFNHNNLNHNSFSDYQIINCKSLTNDEAESNCIIDETINFKNIIKSNTSLQNREDISNDINTEIVTSPSSPLSLNSKEPANKRARLSNS